jgi:type IX secretion system PorP/SprF family membrane protein
MVSKIYIMKKVFITIIAVVCVWQVGIGQSVPLFTQYNINPFVINPAAAGLQEGQQVHFNYRAQWTGFPTAPTTGVLSYQGQFNNNGVGALFFNDNTGALNYQGVFGAYNYQFSISDDYKLAVGLSTQFLRYSIDANSNSFTNIDMTDQVIQEALEGVNQLDFSFGAFLQGENGLYVGLSAPHLLQARLNASTEFNDLSYLATHYFALVGYRTKDKAINFEPSILVRKVINTPFQVEINNKFWFANDNLMAGVSYRTAEQTLALMFGAMLNNKFGFYYSYDAGFNEVSNYHTGSHELTLQLVFGKKELD